MLDDVGSGPIFILGLIALVLIIIELAFSVGIAFILKRVLEKKSGKKMNKGLFIITVVAVFILLSQLQKIPGRVEKYRKDNYEMPTSSTHIKIDSVEKSIQPSQAIVTFNLTVDQAGKYLFMPGMSPCYELTKFNGEDQTKTSNLPVIDLYENKPNMIKIIFSRYCPEPTYSISVGIYPKNPDIDLDDWTGVTFVGDKEKWREVAWISYINNHSLYIFTPEFNLGNDF
jgi:hypothetical protein